MIYEENFSAHVKEGWFLILRGIMLTQARWSETFQRIIYLWLMWCKNYRNWSRFTIAESLLSHFLVSTLLLTYLPAN